MKIAILMLVYNAPKYTFQSIKSLRITKSSIPYELIVVDNGSKKITQLLLSFLKKLNWIDKLKFNGYNALFAKGNNIASRMVSDDVTHYLLLNSDILVKSPQWLDKLSQLHSSSGISALGAVLNDPIRADGYCLLIDRWLYDKYLLDEDFEWWWSVTKLESQVLKEGLPIRAVSNHENLLHHFGGASGKGWVDAKGMDVDIQTVLDWFKGKKESVSIIDSI